jgi:hypothetical protein
VTDENKFAKLAKFPRHKEEEKTSHMAKFFSVSPNLAKYAYGLLPLEQHHTIEKK